MPAKTLLMASNFYLRKAEVHSLKIRGVAPVSTSFHARHNAVQRTYLYRFMHGCHSVPIFESGRVHAIWRTLDIEKMQVRIVF